MVKEYTRSAAGKEILNFQVLRPFSVLEKTVFHLMKYEVFCQFSAVLFEKLLIQV